MMQSQSRHRQAALRAIGPGALLAISIGLSGCAPGYIEEAGYPDYLCGFLYACGSHSDPNQGGNQTATGTSNNNSNGNSTGNTSDDTTTDGE